MTAKFLSSKWILFPKLKTQKQFVILSLLILYNLIEYASHNFNICWFRHHLIHLVSPSLLNILLLRMPSTSHNHRLLIIMPLNILPYPLSGLIAIHYRHTTVHKYQSILTLAFTIRLLNHLDCFLSILGLIYVSLDVMVCGLHHYLEA